MKSISVMLLDLFKRKHVVRKLKLVRGFIKTRKPFNIKEFIN